jgi:predicted aspartyl protease
LASPAAAAVDAAVPPPPLPPPNVAPLPPAVIDNSLVIGGDDLKARQAETRMTVEVRVNGRGPFHFVVDSGADTSVVGIHVAHDLALPLGTPTILNGTTERALVNRVFVDQLTLGQTTFGRLQLPALKEYDVGGDGLVGIDALVNQRLMMDFEKHVIKVEDARMPEQNLMGAIVIVARRRRGQLILTHVTAAGLPLDAVIDTGSEITIGNLKLRDRLIRGNHDKFTTVMATGVTGKTVELQLARIAELRLGPVVLRNVPMAFADVPPFIVFGLSKEPALLLGTDLLETFRRVSLDFRSRKVRFQLRRCETSGVAISTAPDSGFTRLSSDSQEACLR